MADASLPAVQSAEWRNWIATAPQLLGDNSGSRRKYAVACVAYLESVPDPLALDLDPDGLSRERALALTEIGIDPLDSDDDESGFLVWLTAIAAAGFVAAAALPSIAIGVSVAEVLSALFALRTYRLKREREAQSERIRRAMLQFRLKLAR